MHKSENQLTLVRFHVPLIIYAPKLIKKGQIFDKVASEVDLLPTIANLASTSCINSTFGRNLLCNRFDSMRYAFTIRHSRVPGIGLISDKFYFLAQGDGTQKRLKVNNKLYETKSTDPVWEHQRKLCLDEELNKRTLSENLKRLIEILENLAKSAEASKSRDDARGRKIIPDYEEVHTPARNDTIVRVVWKDTRNRIKAIQKLL